SGCGSSGMATWHNPRPATQQALGQERRIGAEPRPARHTGPAEQLPHPPEGPSVHRGGEAARMALRLWNEACPGSRGRQQPMEAGAGEGPAAAFVASTGYRNIVFDSGFVIMNYNLRWLVVSSSFGRNDLYIAQIVLDVPYDSLVCFRRVSFVEPVKLVA